MLLDYLSSFAVVLRRIHGNVDICQIDYSTQSKLEFSPYSEVIHGSKIRIIFSEVIQENLERMEESCKRPLPPPSPPPPPIWSLGPKCYQHARK